MGITDITIRTVIAKMNEHGILDGEQRGTHGKHFKVPDALRDGVKEHINSIPRIDSYYLRKQTKREFIGSGQTLSDLYKDY